MQKTPEQLFDAIPILALMLSMGALPFIMVMCTSFVKMSVVFSLLKNAMGTQQTPPAMVLNSLAIILTVFVMSPVISEISKSVNQAEISKIKTLDDLERTYEVVKPPVVPFLLKYATETERAFFLDAARQTWEKDAPVNIAYTDLRILIPAFMLSELRRAFEIGFLLFLPFLVVDMIVANILLSMGSTMISPLTISLPLKIFVFVSIDGWSLMAHGLISSYFIT